VIRVRATGRGSRDGRGDSGAIAVLVAILSIVLFGFAALVVDIGNAEEIKGQAENAVDAAALAGVQLLEADAPTTSEDQLATPVTAAVMNYIANNIKLPADAWSSCSDPQALVDAGSVNCISFAIPGDPLPAPNTGTYSDYEVRVQLPTKSVPTSFGELLGVSSIKVHPVSQAVAGQPPPSPCAACKPTLDAEGRPESKATIPPDVRAQIAALQLVHQQFVPGSCPAPGLYANQRITLGSCALGPGSYEFDNTVVVVKGTLALSSSNAADATTLIFSGTGTLQVLTGGQLDLNPANPASPSPISSPTAGVTPSPTAAASPTPSPTPAPESSAAAPVTSAPAGSVAGSAPAGSGPAGSVPVSSPVGSAPVSSPPVSSPPVSSPPVSSPVTSLPPPAGITGVALVFEDDQRSPFDLGDKFSITGSIYSPNQTWQVLSTECVSNVACVVTNGVLAVSRTDFTAGTTPFVEAVPPLASPTPVASTEPHLVK
jgi:Flp pilus assembly protein TadG